MHYVRVAVAQIPGWNVTLEAPIPYLEYRKEPHDEIEKLVESLWKSLAKDIKSTARELPKLIKQRGCEYLNAIIKFCQQRDVDILVLPEHSVAASWLPELKSYLTGNSTKDPISVVIAGTHLFEQKNKDIYEGCNLAYPSDWNISGAEWWVAPVLVKGTGGKLVPKQTISGYDLYRRPYRGKSWNPIIHCDIKGKKIRLTVLICSDFVKSNFKWQIINSSNKRAKLDIIAVPAWNSGINDFYCEANYWRREQGVVTAIANRAEPVPYGNHKGKPAGRSMIYASTPPTAPIDENKIRNGNGSPLKDIIYSMPPDSMGLSIFDLDLDSQKNKGGEPIMKVTVAPIILERDFPEYSQFWKKIKDIDPDPLSEPDRKEQIILSGEAQKIRDKTSTSAEADKLLKMKLREVYDHVEMGSVKSLYKNTRETNDNQYDWERLADVVLLPDAEKPIADIVSKPVKCATELLNRIHPPHPDFKTIVNFLGKWGAFTEQLHLSLNAQPIKEKTIPILSSSENDTMGVVFHVYMITGLIPSLYQSTEYKISPEIHKRVKLFDNLTKYLHVVKGEKIKEAREDVFTGMHREILELWKNELFDIYRSLTTGSDTSMTFGKVGDVDTKMLGALGREPEILQSVLPSELQETVAELLSGYTWSEGVREYYSSLWNSILGINQKTYAEEIEIYDSSREDMLNKIGKKFTRNDLQRFIGGLLSLSYYFICLGISAFAYLGLLLIGKALCLYVLWYEFPEIYKKCVSLKRKELASTIIRLNYQMKSDWVKLREYCRRIILYPKRAHKQYPEVIDLMLRIFRTHFEIVALSVIDLHGW